MFPDIERYVKNQMYARALPEVMLRFGTEVEVIRTVQRAATPQHTEAYKRLYGQFSSMSRAPTVVTGDTDPGENVRFEAKILMPFGKFMKADDGFASDFEPDTIVTADPVAVGDVIRIIRADAVRKLWRITDDEKLGITVGVFRRWPVQPAEG